MTHINLGSQSDVDHHICDAEREGDWIVFRCTRCQGYERRMNWRTGETSVENSTPTVQHSGFYLPEELIATIMN